MNTGKAILIGLTLIALSLGDRRQNHGEATIHTFIFISTTPIMAMI